MEQVGSGIAQGSGARSRDNRRGRLAKRVNYGFGKRQKELKRQKKREEKAEKKRLKKEAASGDDQADIMAPGEESATPDQDPSPDSDEI